jgi:hypothetical protein
MLANDGSAQATPAGGIQLVREARISMEKERLAISRDLITVEYEFLNTTSHDITTEVAFPVPEYDIHSMFTAGPSDLEGWHVWVENKELKYQTETKAFLNGADFTSVLRSLSIDIGSFGHWDADVNGRVTGEVSRLPRRRQEELVRAGLLKDDLPLWSVRKTYHWQQLFPANKTLHVRHEYKPELGLEHLDEDTLRGKKAEDFVKLADVCVDAPVRKALIAVVPNDNGFAEGSVEGEWIDYILTTANTWKTPIREFELLIERPKPKGNEHYLVSLCWEGKVEKRGVDTFAARATNFTPKHELRVMFFQIGK